jgi:hypothetical protein
MGIGTQELLQVGTRKAINLALKASRWLNGLLKCQHFRCCCALKVMILHRRAELLPIGSSQ